jgi:GNAT superfamily N-acetyltransferase
LDAGYLCRILSQFETQNLIEKKRLDDDGRQRLISLTGDGQQAFATLDARSNEEVAKLRLLLVDPKAGGLGLGKRLVEECIRFARRSGYKKLTLWTNDVLVAARKIYEGHGFTLVEEEHHHSFGHDLVGRIGI